MLDKTNAIAYYLETSAHHMTCVTKTMNGEKRLKSKHCSKLWTMTLPKRIRPYDL
jgi:hypothetical protein